RWARRSVRAAAARRKRRRWAADTDTATAASPTASETAPRTGIVLGLDLVDDGLARRDAPRAQRRTTLFFFGRDVVTEEAEFVVEGAHEPARSEERRVGKECR